MDNVTGTNDNTAEVPGIALGFSYSVQLNNGSNLVLQGAVDLSASLKDQSATLDKVRMLIERQGTAAEITRLEGELENRKLMLKGMLSDIARIDQVVADRAKSGDVRDTRNRVSKQDAEQRNAVVNNAESIKKNIEDTEERINKLRASLS